MTTPSKTFILPQDSYFTHGKLADQITYPKLSTTSQYGKLRELLDVVELTDIAEQEGGLDAVKDWRYTLAGGQKQELAWARLYFNEPDFSLVDEGTSAVSDDMVNKLSVAAPVNQLKSIWVFASSWGCSLRHTHAPRGVRAAKRPGPAWLGRHLPKCSTGGAGRLSCELQVRDCQDQVRDDAHHDRAPGHQQAPHALHRHQGRRALGAQQQGGVAGALRGPGRGGAPWPFWWASNELARD